MHELSIAMRLVDAANTAAHEAGATTVESVQLRLGTMAGVMKDALLFSFDIATDGTLLAGARLDIEDVPATIYCSTCDAEVELATIQRFRCPHCDTPSGQIVRGRELELIAMEITE